MGVIVSAAVGAGLVVSGNAMTLAIEVSSPLNSLPNWALPEKALKAFRAEHAVQPCFVWKLRYDPKSARGEGRGIRGTCPAYPGRSQDRHRIRQWSGFSGWRVISRPGKPSSFPITKDAMLFAGWSARGMFPTVKGYIEVNSSSR